MDLDNLSNQVKAVSPVTAAGPSAVVVDRASAPTVAAPRIIEVISRTETPTHSTVSNSPVANLFSHSASAAGGNARTPSSSSNSSSSHRIPEDPTSSSGISRTPSDVHTSTPTPGSVPASSSSSIRHTSSVSTKAPTAAVKCMAVPPTPGSVPASMPPALRGTSANTNHTPAVASKPVTTTLPSSSSSQSAVHATPGTTSRDIQRTPVPTWKTSTSSSASLAYFEAEAKAVELTCSSYDSLPKTVEDLEEAREAHSNSAATLLELMAHKAKQVMSLHVQFKDIHAVEGATTAEVSCIDQRLRELKTTVDERLLEIDSEVLSAVRVMIPSAQTIAFATDDRPLTSDRGRRHAIELYCSHSSHQHRHSTMGGRRPDDNHRYDVEIHGHGGTFAHYNTYQGGTTCVSQYTFVHNE